MKDLFIEHPGGNFAMLVIPYDDDEFLDDSRETALFMACREIDQEVLKETSIKAQVFSFAQDVLSESIMSIISENYKEHYDHVLVRFFLRTVMGPHPYRIKADGEVAFFVKHGIIDPRKIKSLEEFKYRQYDITVDDLRQKDIESIGDNK